MLSGGGNGGIGAPASDEAFQAERRRRAEAALGRMNVMASRHASPRRRRQLSGQSAALRLAVSEPRRPPSDGVVTVIVIDDMHVTRELTVRALRADPRFDVVGVGRTGVEAVALAVLEAPDIVVLDNDMPEMTGVEAAADIHDLCPGARLCLYTESPFDCPEVDLVLAKGLPGPELGDHLASLAGPRGARPPG